MSIKSFIQILILNINNIDYLEVYILNIFDTKKNIVEEINSRYKLIINLKLKELEKNKY